jgi:hypothetical protein
VKGGLPISPPFPQFFTESAKNLIQLSQSSLRIVPALSHLQNTPHVGPYFQQMLREFEAIDVGNHPTYSFKPEDVSDLKEELYNIIEHYTSYVS